MADEQPDAVPSIAVVEAVAATQGVPAEDLDELLADVIDPKALDRLIASVGECAPTETLVQFTYCDCLVTVRGDGTIAVE